MKRFTRAAVFVATAVFSALPSAGVEVAENLLLVTFDGLRWQEFFGGIESQFLTPTAATREVEDIRALFWAETPEERRMRLLPFLWGVVAKEGQIFGDASSGSLATVTNDKRFSYPGYSELLAGTADPRITSNDKIPNPNVTVLEFIHQQPDFEGKVAASCSWDVFPFIINVERSGIPVNAGWEGFFPTVDTPTTKQLKQIAGDTPHYWKGVRFDVFTHEWAVEYIRAHQPRVMFVSYGETDDWAHDRKYDMYARSARKTDEFIQRLWEMLQSLDQYRGKTAMLISTDHGRGSTLIDWTSHGEKLPVSDRIWMAAMGAGIPAKGIVQNQPVTQSQFAATAAALVGLNFPGAHPEAAPAIKLD